MNSSDCFGMTRTEGHDGKEYPLYGPVEMNHTEIAEALSEALGQTITYIPISVEEFAQTLTNRGFGAHIVQHLSNVAVDYRNGVFAGTNHHDRRHRSLG